MEELDFRKLEEEVYSFLGNKKTMVLATSSENRVTARSMSCIIFDRKIYFQTDKRFVKYEQILKNSNVALCIDNFQIEGIAKISGQPKDGKNSDFSRLFKENYKSSYDAYSNLQSEVVVEVIPTLITIWKYEGKQALRDFLDVRNKKAYRFLYNPK